MDVVVVRQKGLWCTYSVSPHTLAALDIRSPIASAIVGET